MEHQTAPTEEIVSHHESETSLEQKQQLENKVIKLTLDNEVKVVPAILTSGATDKATKTNNLSVTSLEQ